jgi:glycosyltransferase involved in cell wall biosynthesis
VKESVAIAIVRTPNIQIYEALTELLALVTNMSYRLEIVCPMRMYEDEPLWKPEGVEYRFTRPKSTKLQMPTALKLFINALVVSLKYRPVLLIGGDRLGNILAAIVHKLTRVPYLYYGLELPGMRRRNMTLIDRMEHWSIRVANTVVTMDEHHSSFICKQVGISKDRCIFLPNATSGPAKREKTDVLRRKFFVKDEELLLVHAGGIGAAQQSIELANAARNWGQCFHLIFHAHCRMDEEKYFQQFADAIQSANNVHLNNQPVSSEQLDALISSADIGIAWYDRDLLGYRAELLGLAPGKIGRYLKNGLPVIAPNLPTIKEYLDEYACGICVDRLDDIASAVETIKTDYMRFSQNALRCYEELWRPERYLRDIQLRIEKMVEPSVGHANGGHCS